MKKNLFIKNTAVLTATAIILRTAGMLFRIWLTGAIGAEGIGLYQVTFSVYVFAGTFAASGISTAVTRLSAERLALGDYTGAKRVLKISVALSLLIAGITSAILFAAAGPIAILAVQDMRAEKALRVLGVTLPFVAVSSCIRGYFIAERRSVPQAVCQICEQAVRILITVLLLQNNPKNVEKSVSAVMLGDCVAEFAFMVIILVFYYFSKNPPQKNSTYSYGRALRQVRRIALPITAGKYGHTALRTVENLLVPICFAAYTGARSEALEQFGILKGMALPLLLFPASILTAASTLLIPEIAEAAVHKNAHTVFTATKRSIDITLQAAFWVMAVFLGSGMQIGRMVYHSERVGWLIYALCPLIPLMYIDMINDGLLKGLDKQKTILLNNIADSAIRVILVWLLVPRFGMSGFMGIMVFSNIFTAFFALNRIQKTVQKSLGLFREFLTLGIAATGSVVLSRLLLKPYRFSDFFHIVVFTATETAIYLILLTVSGKFKPKSLNKAFDFMRKKSKTV